MNIKGSELFKKLHIKDVKSQLGMEFLHIAVHLIKITVLYFIPMTIKVNLL